MGGGPRTDRHGHVELGHSDIRRLDLERLAAIELDRVARFALVFVESVEISCDTALPIQVRPARAADLHPLVHEGGDLQAKGKGKGRFVVGKGSCGGERKVCDGSAGTCDL